MGWAYYLGNKIYSLLLKNLFLYEISNAKYYKFFSDNMHFSVFALNFKIKLTMSFYCILIKSSSSKATCQGKK